LEVTTKLLDCTKIKRKKKTHNNASLRINNCFNYTQLACGASEHFALKNQENKQVGSKIMDG